MVGSHARTMVILYGPTAVGKSDFAEKLAQHIPAEIINMDVGQLYTPLSIGTAKPAWRQSAIKHHLFDVLDTPSNYSVTEYRQQVVALLQDIFNRGNIPILVGGSGFYLKSLLFPITAPASQHLVPAHGTAVWQQLYAVDPERARALDPHDVVRIARALEIWQLTGKKPSSFTAHYMPPAPYCLLFLTRDRQELYARINSRVQLMMQEGWLHEVEHVRGTPWEPFLKHKKLIGYDELLSFLAGQQTADERASVIATIAQRTRHYAKRQHTFWRMLEKQLLLAIEQDEANTFPKPIITSVNLTLLDIDLYIKHLSKQLLNAR